MRLSGEMHNSVDIVLVQSSIDTLWTSDITMMESKVTSRLDWCQVVESRAVV